MSAAAHSWCIPHFGPEGSPTTASLLCRRRIHGCGQRHRGPILNWTEHTYVGYKEAVRDNRGQRDLGSITAKEVPGVPPEE